MAGSPRRRWSVAKFRKKPVVIEAVQWAGDNLSEIQSFYRPNQILVGNQIWIETLEGVMKADIGDWIIKGIKGEFCPCKPDIFALTYEPAESPSPPDRDDAAMRDGVRVEATKDEKVKRLVEAARNARNYFCDRYGTGKDNLIVAGKVWQELGYALAEVEKPEVDAEVTRCEVEK
jgi:hypothetical protein